MSNNPLYHNMDRRDFLKATGSAFAALLASGGFLHDDLFAAEGHAGYGPLVEDPDGILDLPEGFSYRVLSSLGDGMDDGGTVPDKADGMGCLVSGTDELILIRNHELVPEDDAGGVIEQGFGMRNGSFVPGGTTHIVMDADTLAVKREFRSLGGTIRNCAGGTTPWNSWLSCEESTSGPDERLDTGLSRNHGWVFEVPASTTGLIDPVPLEAMGRFNHEAVCIDPQTGVAYLTEDRNDSVLYRFIPDEPGTLAAGGRLQAMCIEGVTDSRNWSGSVMLAGRQYGVRWIDLDRVDSPDDDLRFRAAAAGATLIARGEGIHMGANEVFAVATNGGVQKLGQIFRLNPGRSGARDTAELFFESTSPDQLSYGDNLTVAPDGHLVVCEDKYSDVVDNHLRGITPDGHAYKLGRLRLQTELAGACFSPDGRWMFVNAYSPTRTLAITGPWSHLA